MLQRFALQTARTTVYNIRNKTILQKQLIKDHTILRVILHPLYSPVFLRLVDRRLNNRYAKT
jgi:hypothetical protein